jgi:hypothetical protein
MGIALDFSLMYGGTRNKGSKNEKTLISRDDQCRLCMPNQTKHDGSRITKQTREG